MTLKCTIVTAVALAGCAHGVTLDEMSASGHRAEAEREQARSLDELARYNPNANLHATVTSRRPSEIRQVTFNPTADHKDKADAIERHAQQHLAAADALDHFEDAACTPFATEVRAACPATGPIAAVEDIRGGVRLLVQPDQPISVVLKHMRCHLAYARAIGWQAAPDCPLYLKGVDIRLSPDGKSIDMTARDGKTTRELRRRARVEVTPSI
jgi:hypothetical protein